MTDPTPIARDRACEDHPAGEHPGGKGHGPPRPRPGPGPADLPAPGASPVAPAAVRSFRSQLTIGEDVVDPSTWAGSVPEAHGIAPRVRIGRSRWFNMLWLPPIGFVILIAAVAAAKGLRDTPAVAGSSPATPAPPTRPMRFPMPGSRPG